jgi:ankyrin repeat protein
MEYLFDSDQPHFKSWLTLYDIDTMPREVAAFHTFVNFDKSAASPLYYAALCGFHDLVQHLVVKYPQSVNADGGHYVRPLVAALAGGHFRTADLLNRHGASPDVRGGYSMDTPLHSVAGFGTPGLVQKLIEYGADVNAESVMDGWTPLYLASAFDDLKVISSLRLLLEHGADVNALTKHGAIPLHRASAWGSPAAVRLLLEHGSDIAAVNGEGKTSLQVVGKISSRYVDQRRRDEITKLLLEHRVK